MRAALLVLLTLPLGCATPAPPPPQGPPPRSPLVASLQRGGFSLRPEPSRPLPVPSRPSPPPPVKPPPPASSLPSSLRRPDELRLLAGRLGRPPSLGLGCAPLGEAAPIETAATALRSCLGASLGPPFEAAAVVEQVAGRKVVAVAAEEGFPDAPDADARFQALLARLRAVLGTPELRAGQLLFRLRGHTLSLDLLPGATSYVTLQLRTNP